MCLIIFNWEPNSQRPLTLAANRDEFHLRPSQDAHFWEDNPNIFGGRDLEKKGTWLGLSKNSAAQTYRLAALTNFRRVDNKKYEHSRGEITHQFLNSDQRAYDYAQNIPYHQYAGFNGLLFDGDSLVYCHHEADQAPEILPLKQGIYGLSNAKLNTPWPKVERTKLAFESLNGQASHEEISSHLLNYLRFEEVAEDNLLPDTGVGIALERMLSPPFIISPSYGTRTASVVIVDNKEESKKQTVYFQERQFSNNGTKIRELIKDLN